MPAFSTTIHDTLAAALPPDWNGTGYYNPISKELELPASRTFASVLASIDAVYFTTYIPGFFYGDVSHDIAVDNIFIEQAPQFAGDANGDSVVDFTDLGILLNNYDQPGTFSLGDFDHSGLVDFTDLGILLNHYNEHAPLLAAAAVPEPGTLALAVFGAIGLLVAARRKR